MSEETGCSSWWSVGSNLTNNLSAGLGSLSSNVTSISTNVTNNLSNGLGSLSSNVTGNIGSLSDVKNNLTDGLGSISSNVSSTLPTAAVDSISNVTSYGVESLSGVTSNLSNGMGSLWTKAKETGSYVYDFTANDFNEVATALKHDVIVPGATALKHKLQPHAQYGSLTDSVATMLGNVSEYLAPPTQPNIEMLSRYGQDRVQAIQTSQDTYKKHEPDEQFMEWCTSFSLEERTHEISQLLVDNQKLRNLHTELVPTEMSYSNFWRIYYYRTDLFNKEKERHEALLSRADHTEEDELKWSDDEEDLEEGPGVITVQPGLPATSQEEAPDADCISTAVQSGEINQQGESADTAEASLRLDTIHQSSSEDLKLDASSEEGSYDVIKHKELISEIEEVQKDTDDEFVKELDEMVGDAPSNGDKIEEDDNGWEDWD